MGFSKYLAIGLIILAGAFYFYFHWSQGRIEALQAENSANAAALSLERATNATLREQFNSSSAELRRTQDALRTIEKQNARLAKLLSDHDLGKLAREKPGLIENRLNSGTDKVFSDIEEITK